MNVSGSQLLQPRKWPRAPAEDQNDVQLRRATVGATIAGGAAMAAIRLLRSGALSRLPDPHSHRTVLSRQVDKFGRSDRVSVRKDYMPKDSFAFLLHAANMALAAAGPADRASRQPYLPLLASFATGAQAVVSARYLVRTLRKADDRWCPYCVTDAVTHFTTFALTLPEAVRAAKRMLRDRRR